MEERRKLHGLALDNAFGLEDDEALELVFEGVELEVLSSPDEALSQFTD